jgi:hypothetical protein
MSDTKADTREFLEGLGKAILKASPNSADMESNIRRIVADAKTAWAQQSRDQDVAYVGPKTLVKIHPRQRMNLYCLGKGSPAVILESGMMDEIARSLCSCPKWAIADRLYSGGVGSNECVLPLATATHAPRFTRAVISRWYPQRNIFIVLWRGVNRA